MASFSDKMKHAYNSFTTTQRQDYSAGEFYGSGSYGSRPDRVRNANIFGERSIVQAIYTRISIDIASIQLRHVKLVEQDRFTENILSGLNNCLTVEANIDQGSRDFRQDIAMTLCSKG